MEYKKRISELIRRVPKTIVDLSVEREKVRIPTQASSNFITNREQGDWAESLVQKVINETSKNFLAVKYGKSDDRVAGEEGFNKFFEAFQEELDSIGKRPDILVFNRSDFQNKWGLDISRKSRDFLDLLVPKAIAGLEIRSSSFLIEKYDRAMQERISRFTTIALEAKDIILHNYFDLLNHQSRKKYLDILKGINDETLSAADFRRPNWSSSQRLVELTEQFKILKDAIKEIQKRDFLSITPKVEDLKVVYQWIQTYNVPHFYFQVFFDKVYGMSYKDILELISDSDNEGDKFFLEGDVKNQNKITVKINSKQGIEIANKIDMPIHRSKMKELERGRLLFYVTFEGGFAYLDVNNLLNLLNIESEEF
ncbi:MAG: restriction endonuclease [Desulfobacteraceae bacterium IS3]|nr:MAG: restriction endonuclease [Desulfobacteraceae bacterium IS3]